MFRSITLAILLTVTSCAEQSENLTVCERAFRAGDSITDLEVVTEPLDAAIRWCSLGEFVAEANGSNDLDGLTPEAYAADRCRFVSGQVCTDLGVGATRVTFP